MTGSPLREERVRDLQRGRPQVGDQLGDLAGVRLRLGRAVERLLEPRGGDQLHRPGDLADILHRLAAHDDRSGLGHGYRVSRRRGSFEAVAVPRPKIVLRLPPSPVAGAALGLGGPVELP